MRILGNPQLVWNGIGSRSPPDSITQPFGMRLKAQQSRRIGKHRTWIGLSEALAAQQLGPFSAADSCFDLLYYRHDVRDALGGVMRA